MPALTLYNYDLDDSCYRVRLFLAMLELPYASVAVDMVPGNEQEGPALRALNPLATLPILQDAELTLYGTEAILGYLAKAYETTGNWLPSDPVLFGKVLQWLTFSAGVLPAASAARKLSLFGGAGDEVALRALSRNAFRIMDDHMAVRQLEGADWFVGDGPTLADLTLFPSFALSRDFSIDHDEFPALRRWIRRFRALKGFGTMPGIPDYH